MERHRTDPLSLVFGLLFVAAAIVGLSDRIELSAADVRWVAPGLLVLVGVLLVLPFGRDRAGRATSEPAATVAEPADSIAEPADSIAEPAATTVAEPADPSRDAIDDEAAGATSDDDQGDGTTAG